MRYNLKLTFITETNKNIKDENLTLKYKSNNTYYGLTSL